MQLRRVGRAVSLSRGRVTISFMVGGRTNFARWWKRYSEGDFYGRGLWTGFSCPRLSVAIIVKAQQPLVIGR
jgi:hypothetical protein